MKIVILNGSTRKNGATARMLKRAEEILAEKPETEILYRDISNYDLKQCIGCRKCYSSGSCIFKDDGGEALAKEMKNADAVIMGSSTFGSHVTGQLKTFMDRSHLLVEQGLYNIYSLGLVTYEIAEGGVALKALNKFFQVAGAISGGSHLVKLKFDTDPFAKKKELKLWEKRIHRFHRIAHRKKSRSLYERFFTNMVLIPIIWKPIFLKRIDEYRGVLRNWQKVGLLDPQLEI